MKKCPKCGEPKEDNCFYVQKSAKKKGQLSSWCKECCNKKSAQRYKDNPEKCREEHKKWVSQNRDKVAFSKAKSQYGISKEEYDKMPNFCVICGSTENLCIDHSHRTGRIRGKLCHSCNKGLGFFNDNPILLERAADYLMGVATPEQINPKYAAVETKAAFLFKKED